MSQTSVTMTPTPAASFGSLRLARQHQYALTFAHYGAAFGSVLATKRVATRLPAMRGIGSGFGRVVTKRRQVFGAFRDFAHYPDDVIDPARLLYLTSTSGPTLDATQSSGMRRVSLSVVTPRDYPVSDGYAWRKAAYVGLGVRVNAMQAGTSQFVDAAQVEVRPYNIMGPSPYAPARSLQIKIRPDRLNYAANPELQNDDNDWASTPVNPTRVAQGSGFALSVPGSAESGFSSGTDTVPGTLWAGRITVSGPKGKVLNVRLLDNTQTFTSPVLKVLLTGSPQEVVLSPTATTAGTNIRVHAYPVADGGAWTSSDRFTMTKVLLERVRALGAVPGPYFTGASGADYLWEAGSTPGSGRSYYYRDRSARAYLLGRLLEENCPLGVIPAVPQFAVLPSE